MSWYILRKSHEMGGSYQTCWKENCIWIICPKLIETYLTNSNPYHTIFLNDPSLPYLGNTYKKYLHKIIISQKKAIRILNHAKYNASSSLLFKHCNILKFEDLYKVTICQLMLKLHNDMVPLPLHNMLQKNQDIIYIVEIPVIEMIMLLWTIETT